MLDAEIVVSTLVLPELLKRLTLEFAELELLLLDSHCLCHQLFDKLSLKTQVRDSQLATVIVTSSVCQLKARVSCANCSFDIFPVDLKLLTFFQLNIELHDKRVIEVLLNKDDSPIGSDLGLNGSSIGSRLAFASGFGVSLALSVESGECLVGGAANFSLVVIDVNLSGIDASFRNFLR